MFFPKSWFSGRRAALSARRSHVVNLEDRTLLAAVISWSSPAPTSFRVEGTTAGEAITVGVNGGGNFEVNTIDTGISAGPVTLVTVIALDGADTITLGASLGARGAVVQGGLGDDTIIASNGGSNDLRGQGGADHYSGGTGSDKFNFDEFDLFVGDSGGGGDRIDGSTAGAGVSWSFGLAGIESFKGTPFNDLINATGETGVVVILGEAGSDTLTGGSGADVIRGNLGNDRINGGGGNDILIGQEGNDTIDGGAGSDTIDHASGTGSASINLSTGIVASDGLGGVDSILSQSVENVFGTNFDDVIIGNAAVNYLRGNAGNDKLTGGLGDDELVGGDGKDILRGEAGMDRVDGGNDDDTIQADGLDDNSVLFTGGAGIDTLIYENISTAVNWILKANSSFQTIAGSNADDSIDASLQTEAVSLGGNAGMDTLIGTALDDKLVGGAGNDTLIGGDGADSLRGGVDNDLLIGGTLLVPNDGKADLLSGDAGIDRAVGLIAGTPGTLFALDTRLNLESVIL